MKIQPLKSFGVCLAIFLHRHLLPILQLYSALKDSSLFIKITERRISALLETSESVRSPRFGQLARLRSLCWNGRRQKRIRRFPS